MSKFFFLIILLFSYSNAATKSIWAHTYSYTLKKDEIANLSMSTTESKGEDKSGLFFRWTQVTGERVTVLLNDNGHPHQYILYKKRSLDRIKLNLLKDGSNNMEDITYMVLVLTDINQGKDEVNFDIFIKDNKNRILVDFGGEKVE